MLNNLTRLGAHACGWAGKYARNFLPHWQLGRIDALDPAGPWFDDKPKDGRLHLDDARFVQVIHTNGGLYSDGEDTIGKFNQWLFIKPNYRISWYFMANG